MVQPFRTCMCRLESLHHNGEDAAVEFIDPRDTPFVQLKSRGELPHLYKPGACYFVSFRLADAIRQRRGEDSLAARSRSAPKDLDPQELLRNFEPPLALGCCWLRRPEIASLVQNAFLHFNKERYELVAWCVMPNHAHVVFAPFAGRPIPTILNSWKGFTGKKANEILQRHGPFWERESFDHLIRTAEAVERFAKYVEDNPVEAGLCSRAEDWPFSSAGAHFESPLGRR